MAGTTYGPVVLVHGLCGSTLYQTGTPRQIWADWRELVGPFGFYKCALASNGIDPDPTYGLELTPGEQVSPHYGPWLQVMMGQASKWGFGPVKAWSYDWRKDPIAAGHELAVYIHDLFTLFEQPVNIVAHSQGGLVARMAWRDLRKLSAENQIRRIICLGTPHKGAYTAAAALATYQTYVSRWLWGVPFALTAYYAVWKVDPSYSTEGQMWSRVTSNMPGVYALLPSLDSTSVATDPARKLLYQASNYPPRSSVQQTWLDWAKGTWQAALADPDSMPPGDRITTIAGDTVGTQFRAGADQTTPLQPGFFEINGEGDGLVDLGSAHLDGARQLTAPALHQDQPTAWALSQLIAEAIAYMPPPAVTAEVPIQKYLFYNQAPVPLGTATTWDVQSTIEAPGRSDPRVAIVQDP